MASPLRPGIDLLDEMRSRLAGSGHEGPIEVTRSAGEFEMVFRVADADRLGVLVDEIEVVRRTGTAGAEDLDRQARALMSGVSSLGDRFALIELEPRLDRAVLRSAAPRVLPEGLEYDEIQLEGGNRATLRRQRFDRASGAREQVRANLAAEVVPRLARELAEALCG